MKIYRVILAVLITALSVPALAASVSFEQDVLYRNPSLNRNLKGDEYDFAGQHSRYGSKFQDSWKFTVAEDTTASISIFDVETSFSQPSAVRSSKSRQLRQRRTSLNTRKIFDTTNLTLSLFDYRGQLIGQTGENGTLSGLDLIAGKWYTIKISGKVSGFFGSSYRGVLDLNPAPTPVPIGGTAPMLGSALAFVALRLRTKRKLAA